MPTGPHTIEARQGRIVSERQQLHVDNAEVLTMECWVEPSKTTDRPTLDNWIVVHLAPDVAERVTNDSVNPIQGPSSANRLRGYLPIIATIALAIIAVVLLVLGDVVASTVAAAGALVALTYAAFLRPRSRRKT